MSELFRHHKYSSCKALFSLSVTTSIDLPVQWIVVSSAYMYVVPDVIALGISLVYKLYSTGPRTDPWGFRMLRALCRIDCR